MKDFRIVVEGKADIKFLQDFIAEHFDIHLEDSYFINNKGNVLTQNTSVGLIQASINSGKEICVIFDADNPDREGTEAYLTQKKQEFGIHFATFLFPNNQGNGNLETLLREIVAADKVPVLACIESYARCLSELQIEHLRESGPKMRMFVYVDSFEIGGSGKEARRNYRELGLWNLHHQVLEPLEAFLRQYLMQE
jgi:hypothetical protein